jgi:hypothetical protein
MSRLQATSRKGLSTAGTRATTSRRATGLQSADDTRVHAGVESGKALLSDRRLTSQLRALGLVMKRHVRTHYPPPRRRAVRSGKAIVRGRSARLATGLATSARRGVGAIAANTRAAASHRVRVHGTRYALPRRATLPGMPTILHTCRPRRTLPALRRAGGRRRSPR